MHRALATAAAAETALFDDLFALLPQDPQVLEVGPGPGKATRDLLTHGARVHAVEIGPALGETLRTTSPSNQLTVGVGDFEGVPVDATTFDCVLAASAYHWITPRAQLDRPAVALKTYNSAEYRQLMESYSVTQMMSPGERRALLDDMEASVRDQFDNEVVRPLVVTLTTARLAIATTNSIRQRRRGGRLGWDGGCGTW